MRELSARNACRSLAHSGTAKRASTTLYRRSPHRERNFETEAKCFQSIEKEWNELVTNIFDWIANVSTDSSDLKFNESRVGSAPLQLIGPCTCFRRFSPNPRAFLPPLPDWMLIKKELKWPHPLVASCIAPQIPPFRHLRANGHPPSETDDLMASTTGPTMSPALKQRHSTGSRRLPASSSTPGTPTGRPSALDLETLRVVVAELRLTPDGTWLYVLRVTTASTRGWLVPRRYSELRAFWDALRAAMAAHGPACEERVHFLAGLEADKFPRKRLLHTKHALEARANELDDLLLRLSMRLNLCSARAADACRARGCPVLALLAAFLRPDEALAHDDPSERTGCSSASSGSTAAASPSRAPLAKYRSFPLRRADAENRFVTASGRRLSFAGHRDAPRGM